jgi:hypothetical protein
LKEVLRDTSLEASHDVEHAISRLGRAINVLLVSRWSESHRSRAEELAETLVNTCRRARAHRAMRTAQALHALVKLDEDDLYLIHGPLRDKLFELLALVRIFGGCN